MVEKAYIKTAIQIIERSISEKIKIEHLSTECFVSTRQLYRDFYSYTGHSINEYIRKRRISKALSLIKHSNLAIADIAYLCGYSSQQALCKSVKLSILMTPTQYRNNKNTYYYFPLYEEEKMRQIVIENKTIPKMICIKFYHSQLTSIENRAIKYLQSVLTTYTGKLIGRNGLQRGHQFCYEVYIEFNEEYINILEKLQTIEYNISPIYNAIFACIAVKNNEQDINEAWAFLYGHWLKTSMFELDNTLYFEEYMIKDNIIKKLILHLPVKPKEHFHKINICGFEDRLLVVSTKTGINAEKSATNTVLNFIGDNHAYLMKTQKEYYISQKKGAYTCGMILKKSIYIPGDGRLELVTVPSGLYAVLEGSCFDNADEYEHVLLQWLQENGVEIIGEPFSIYDTSKGTNPNDVIVKSQVRIKDGRII
ncbi:MAG: hypothetical protein K0S61_3179 [Anaerocolumna sp.]|nr:hypothetical protein [Anaerocolumna sp.]